MNIGFDYASRIETVQQQLFGYHDQHTAFTGSNIQTTFPIETITIPNQNQQRNIERPQIVCDLNKADFDMYPYMDTMYCIDVENNKAANNDNISGLNGDRIRYCQHTDGTWEGYGEDDSYGERDDDDDDW